MAFNLAVSQPTSTRVVRYFSTDQGARIYQLPLEAFPGFWVYSYLVLVDEYQVLIDTGSGFGECNQHLEACLNTVDRGLQEDVGLPHLTHILITHGHIDHFGGLTYVRSVSPAKVGVHELDLRNLTNTEERLTIVSKRLDDFLTEAGITQMKRRELIQLYKLSKLDYVPIDVDFTYEAVGMCVGPFEIYHMPGHCAGEVVIRLQDVLFSGDHVLSEISPHQAPQRLVINTGLGHYLISLDALQKWSGEIRLTLGGHNEVITDLSGRIDEIREVHNDRLVAILEILSESHTISEISCQLFQEVHGYNELLALEEAGAHVEYLYQRGSIGINNIDELFLSDEILPVRYCRLQNA
jgi:glyoxylase-like metal-dependent hydrolase (beta-lactamase superfamily II)